jgi:hypothetical protein
VDASSESHSEGPEETLMSTQQSSVPQSGVGADPTIRGHVVEGIP